jgi:RNA polymerase sigma-70 factor, ECF subfamily
VPEALPSPDAERVSALLRGDAEAFARLVDEHHGGLLRVARAMLRDAAVAEEVVQETWLAVLDGLPSFEGRSSLRTWMFRILSNRAYTRGKREARTIPFSAFATDDDEPVEADRFDATGHWVDPPDRWRDTPERLVGDRELLDRIALVIDALPQRQRAVIVLRDVDGWSSEDVRNALDLSETNQRVLLHRARTKVRAELDTWMKGPT